jgi:hypothetical protein
MPSGAVGEPLTINNALIAAPAFTTVILLAPSTARHQRVNQITPLQLIPTSREQLMIVTIADAETEITGAQHCLKERERSELLGQK